MIYSLIDVSWTVRLIIDDDGRDDVHVLSNRCVTTLPNGCHDFIPFSFYYRTHRPNPVLQPCLFQYLL